MHFTKFDHHLTAPPPPDPPLPSISASSATPPTTITIKHTQPFLSDAPTQTHTHPNKVGQSAIPGRLLSTVKKQTTAPTLNVNVLRRRTRRRRRSREAAGRGKTRQTNQKKKKKGKEGASLCWQPSRWKTRTQMYADDLQLAPSPARVEADEVTNGRLRG